MGLEIGVQETDSGLNTEDKITLEQLKLSFPRERRKFVTQDLVDMINNLDQAGDFDGHLKDKILAYSDILTQGRYKMTDYIKACEFVVNYLNCENQAEAYVKTFPEKVARRLAEGKEPYSKGAPAMYYQGDLVQAIMARAMMSKRLKHYDKIDRAINTLEEVMLNSNSDKVRVEAADKLLNHLAEDPKMKIEMGVEIRKDESGRAIEQKMLELAEMQKIAFEKGMSITEVQKIGMKQRDTEDIEDAEVIDES